MRFKQFGAKGDGVADDTRALQAAVAAANANPNGGVIFLPRGTYLLRTPLTITRSRVVLRGEGVSTASCQPAAPGCACLWRWPSPGIPLLPLLPAAPATGWFGHLMHAPAPAGAVQEGKTIIFIPRSLSHVFQGTWAVYANGEAPLLLLLLLAAQPATRV